MFMLILDKRIFGEQLLTSLIDFRMSDAHLYRGYVI